MQQSLSTILISVVDLTTGREVATPLRLRLSEQGVASGTITGISPGLRRVLAEAFDEQGNSLGTGQSEPLTIVAGPNGPVSLQLTLGPSGPSPTSTPTPTPALLDIVVANQGSNDVSLFFQETTGFTTSLNLAAGNSPTEPALADFDNDGDLDIVATLFTANQVAYLENLGGRSFASPQNLPVGANPNGLATGDVNSDGNVDVVTANAGSGDVSVLLGNGDGTFQTASSFSVGPAGSSAEGVRIFEMDGSGGLDLVVGRRDASNSFSILLGDGAGGFAAPLEILTPTTPAQLDVADLNGDSLPDLAVSNFGSAQVSIVLNNGTLPLSQASFDPPIPISVGGSPLASGIQDFNQDGNNDIVIANTGPATNPTQELTVLLGDGAGGISSSTQLTAGQTGPNGLTTADINGDGNDDLVVANFQAGTVTLFLGNRDGTFQSGLNLTAGSGPVRPVVGELDG